jgi:amino acid adenylation domain-containing protein
MYQAQVEGFHVSPQQRRIWALDGGGDSPYRSRCEVRIRGRLDVHAFREALDEVVARHEILRTTFYASEEMSLPVQVVGTSGPVLRSVDLVAVSADSRNETLSAIRQEAAGRHYDFVRAPLAHVTLVALAPDEHLLFIDLPSLCCDSTGLKNLVAEIARSYDGHGRSGGTPDDPFQYADASTWLNDALTSEEAAPGREFWRRDDFTSLSRLRLPFERTARMPRPFEVRQVPVELSSSAQAKLPSILSTMGISLEVFLLTCLQALVQRATGETHLAVGCVWDGRGYAELETAIGPFARSLPLSGEIPEDLPFGDALLVVSERLAAGTAWGACFDWSLIANWPGATEQSLSVPFLVQHSAWPERYRAGDVEFALEECEGCVDRFKLKLVGRSHQDGDGLFRLCLDYDASLFLHEDIAALAEQLSVLMSDAVEQPTRTMAGLRIVSEEQRRRLLALSAVEGETFPATECVHRIFEGVAARVPADRAVVCDGVVMSYGELNSRANQLACHLRAMGVAPDTVVGLCLERSVNTVVGILGILKAGGAYLPLDPRLPSARLAGIVDDSGASIVVTEECVLDRVPGTVRVVALDRDRASIAANSSENPAAGATPDNLVYVLFTSGSTGRPKGVAVEHRHLAHYVHALASRLELPNQATFATVTTFSADLGNTSVYPALLSGGCLCILTESEASDPAAFAASMQQNEVDVLKIVPSHLKALLSHAEPQLILPRQRLVLGGEASSWDLVEAIRRLAPDLVVLNHYGPTETTVGATTYQIGAESRPDLSVTVPIGRPLADVKVRVLDRDRQLVPCWYPGELYIGGLGVARGYLNAPVTTEERFVADPFAAQGGRLYRTGDQVRILPTGDLEFLGRRDDQIKIRGYRVELGEIEAALLRHESVSEAAVVVREGEDAGDRRLVGCVVPRAGSRVDTAGLSTFLKAEIPEYMVPGAFVSLDALPLTPNGKVDRRALVALSDAAPDVAAQDEQPSTECENVVADIWREFLETDRISVHDNFYDLGGHSLMAIQVVTALEKRMQLRMSPRDLVFHTLRQFAALCESRLAKATD